MQPFTIGERQIAAFQEDAERRYVASVATFLKGRIPEAAEEKSEKLTAFVSAMVNKAKKYGLTSKRDAAVYVTTSYLLGENFEERFEEVQRVLRSPAPGAEKSEWLQRAAVAIVDAATGEQK
jgi:ribosomal protein L17